jgi:hypothetical protein
MSRRASLARPCPVWYCRQGRFTRPKKLFLLASLVLVLQGPVVLSRPPDGPSGRMVLNEVTILKAEVQRLEKVVTHNESKTEDLFEW